VSNEFLYSAVGKAEAWRPLNFPPLVLF